MTITVRRAQPDDAATYARIMGDPAVFPGLLQLPHPNEQSLRTWLTESCAPGKNDLLLVAEVDGEAAGTAGLHPSGPRLRRQHAWHLGISVLPAFQGRGVGSALMAAMCDYADRWAGALRLELSVFVDNERAIALYRRFGFETEGRMRAYALRDGVYVDTYAMARLHPQPPVLPGR